MSYLRSLFIVTLLFSYDGVLSAQALYQKPVKVLGDPHFVGTGGSPLQLDSSGPNVVEGRELNFPLAVALDNSVSPPLVYIADTGNNRVLGYQYSTQMTPGSVADVVLGQIDRFSNLNSQQNSRSTGMNLPGGVAVDTAGNVYVADSGNNRILRYPKPLAQSSAPFPDIVIGQTSLSGRSANPNGVTASTLSLSNGTAAHTGLSFDSSGNLWVADTYNNRVLRFPASVLKAGQNGPSADLVLGQPDFSTTTPANMRNMKTALNHPIGLSFDVMGRLLVSDAESRVLVYQAPISSNAVAIRIVGLDPMSTTGTSQIALNNPFGVVGVAAGVIVADTFNNRVMVFPVVDSWTVEAAQYSPSASAVIGQSSYTASKINGGSADANGGSFNLPVDLASSGQELFVADAQNNRVLVFAQTPSGIVTPASRVIGQLDFPYTAVNLIEGKEFSLESATLSGSAVLDTHANPPHLYVADTLNNRILGFNNFNALPSGTPKADLVIGQPDFFRSQINYPNNDATMPTAQGLHGPTALALDSAGNLYVADAGNSRVLRFPAPFASGKTSLESADLVIGQADFTSIVTDPTAQTLNGATGIALTADAANTSVSSSGWLVVSDTGNDRVLFFQKPFANGMSATKVLGGQNYTSAAFGSAPQSFNAPRGVAVDAQDRILLADTGNSRVQIFDVAKNLSNGQTPLLSLTTGIRQPFAIASTPTGFWVADTQQNGVLHFPSSDPGQLAVTNYMSDSAVPANSPRSVFADPFGDLIVADGIDRVLYFVPEVKIVSAASGSARPQAAGSVVSIYPAVNTAAIANGTSSATATPLPNSLSDTQVLINGTALPLFFVSAGQINVMLPNNLPSGGSVDLQVVRQSTGQIYGTEELALSSASPALFTSNLTGSGQAVAENIGTDGSFQGVNSPTNPVARGQYLVLFGSGEGTVSGAPPDGQPAAGSVPAAGVPQVLLGSAFVPAGNVQYSGLAPGLVGVWQINVLIPMTAQTGSTVPIKVFQNSIPSTDPANPSLANTTVAVK